MLLTVLLLPLQVAAQGHEHDSVSEETGPRFTLRGFADIDFIVNGGATPPGEIRERSAFTLGQFDLYMVSKLTDKIRFLGETVFELNENQETVADVERLQLGYHWSDAFHVAAGRGHTALGYWNEAYHHGKLLQPTVERPEALKFEDDGGILPVHFVGLEAGGSTTLGAWDLAYVAYVANGRGIKMDAVQGAFDANSSKAVGGKLSLSREGRHNFSFGPSVYHDVIPADAAQPNRSFEMVETILGAHLVYRSARLDLFSEYFHVRHESRETPERFSHEAAYAVGVLHYRSWSPYVGIDWQDLDARDPFYPPPYASVTRTLVGLRWDPVSFNCLKLEYARADHPWGVEHSVVLQSAFTF